MLSSALARLIRGGIATATVVGAVTLTPFDLAAQTPCPSDFLSVYYDPGLQMWFGVERVTSTE
jgi:hypothetical protein